MKIGLGNIATSEVVQTVEVPDPNDWQQVAPIEDAVRNQVLDQIRQIRKLGPPWQTESSWEVEPFMCSTNADGSKGKIFFVACDVVDQVNQQFEDTVYTCYDDVLG